MFQAIYREKEGNPFIVSRASTFWPWTFEIFVITTFCLLPQTTADLYSDYVLPILISAEPGTYLFRCLWREYTALSGSFFILLTPFLPKPYSTLFVCLFVCLSVCFLPHLQLMEVPRPWIESELQLWPTAQLLQRQILNPLSQASLFSLASVANLAAAVRFLTHCTTVGTSP